MNDDEPQIEVRKIPPDWGIYLKSEQKFVPNPWSKQFWNRTSQGRLFKQDRAQADRYARAAGHKDALSSSFENAK